MSTLVVEYPDHLPDSAALSRTEFEKLMRHGLAAKLFELGRLSSGQAAALVPMSRYDFLRTLADQGTPALDWHPEEFADEVSNA